MSNPGCTCRGDAQRRGHPRGGKTDRMGGADGNDLVVGPKAQASRAVIQCEARRAAGGATDLPYP